MRAGIGVGGLSRPWERSTLNLSPRWKGGGPQERQAERLNVDGALAKRSGDATQLPGEHPRGDGACADTADRAGGRIERVCGMGGDRR